MPESRTVRYLVTGQSSTGMERSTDAGASPVPEKGDPVRYRNALVPD
jgi:hypothetical protein